MLTYFGDFAVLKLSQYIALLEPSRLIKMATSVLSNLFVIKGGAAAHSDIET
jgi:hypothetical protein